MLLCEANVASDQIVKYTAAVQDGPNTRAHMMFSFLLNARLWLALAREEPEVIVDSLREQPALPAMAQWATFLRNHDELDLSRLTDEQRSDVFAAFASKAEMRIYDRGIRRRLASMLGGDLRHIQLAYSLQFSMPGTPVLRYGEEVGMSEGLSLPGREALRTAMQSDDVPASGFSTAAGYLLVPPATGRGRLGARKVDVRPHTKGQCRHATARAAFVAELVRRDDRHAARMPGDWRRVCPVLDGHRPAGR